MTALDAEQKTLPLEPEPVREVIVSFPVDSSNGEPGIEVHDLKVTIEGGEAIVTLSQTEGGDNAGVTAVGTVIDAAAISTPAVRVPLCLEKFGSDWIKAGQAFTKAAKIAGWQQTQISVIRDQLSAIRQREVQEQKDLSGTAYAVLSPHVCEEVAK